MAKVIVLTRPENAKSAVKLGYPVVMESREIPGDSAVIRWGNGLEPDKRGWSLVLNKATALGISTDKLAAMEQMNRVVNVPALYYQGDSLPRGHRYVCRPASHAEGSDFELVDVTSRAVTCQSHHATRYIEDTNEYRVWFVRDKYLLARRVPIASKNQHVADPCRSKWGYEFVRECFPKLKEEVTKARTAIPLDFGAIDVLWSEADRKYYFLEFNSAPSLDHDKVLVHFQTHLKAILATVATPEVAEQVQTPQSAANRIAARPMPIRQVADPSLNAWEDKYRAKLMAEKKAKEAQIYKEIYGDV